MDLGPEDAIITTSELAELWDMSESRVRDIMRANGIRAVRGYPRNQALTANRGPGQGARTDLGRGQEH
jgi:hypothetical protein